MQTRTLTYAATMGHAITINHDIIVVGISLVVEDKIFDHPSETFLICKKAHAPFMENVFPHSSQMVEHPRMNGSSNN